MLALHDLAFLVEIAELTCSLKAPDHPPKAQPFSRLVLDINLVGECNILAVAETRYTCSYVQSMFLSNIEGITVFDCMLVRRCYCCRLSCTMSDIIAHSAPIATRLGPVTPAFAPWKSVQNMRSPSHGTPLLHPQGHVLRFS